MTKEEAIQILKILKEDYWDDDGYGHETKEYDDTMLALDKAIEALEHKTCDDMGEVSDGYHTFNQLYHQRAVLFATIVNQNKDKSWKSFKHSDGNYCFDSNGEWFIVGIDTPQGSYTYHYAKEYWDMFDCEELECGKEWDGHTEEDVTRLLSLQNEVCTDAISREDALMALTGEYMESSAEILPKAIKRINALPPVKPIEKVGQWVWKIQYWNWVCSECGENPTRGTGHTPNNMNGYKYCPHCGAKMQKVEE